MTLKIAELHHLRGAHPARPGRRRGGAALLQRRDRPRIAITCPGTGRARTSASTPAAMPRFTWSRAAPKTALGSRRTRPRLAPPGLRGHLDRRSPGGARPARGALPRRPRAARAGLAPAVPGGPGRQPDRAAPARDLPLHGPRPRGHRPGARLGHGAVRRHARVSRRSPSACRPRTSCRSSTSISRCSRPSPASTAARSFTWRATA